MMNSCFCLVYKCMRVRLVIIDGGAGKCLYPKRLIGWKLSDGTSPNGAHSKHIFSSLLLLNVAGAALSYNSHAAPATHFGCTGVPACVLYRFRYENDRHPGN